MISPISLIEDFSSAMKEAQQWRDSMPVLEVADLQSPLTQLLTFLSGEIDEASEVQPSHYRNQILKEYPKELVDVIVFFSSLCHALRVSPDTNIVNVRLNGQAKRTMDVYQTLSEMTWDFAGNIDAQRGIDQFTLYFLSLILSLPESIKLTKTMKLKLGENGMNRPSWAFSKVDPHDTDRTLPDIEMIERFHHSNHILRKLRNIFGSPLPYQVSIFFRQMILDFRSPYNEDSFALRLKEFRFSVQQKVQELVLYPELQDFHSLTELLLLLKLAGAKEIQVYP